MQLFNTLTKKIDPLKADGQNPLLVYTCGPTVYDRQHVGNFATFIRYDLLMRALRLEQNQVEWVMNLTDVGHLTSDADTGDDKLAKKARETGETAWSVAEKNIATFTDDLQKLNVIQPDKLIRATDYIDDQIALIKQLEAKGYTYQIDDGIYFDTGRFESYADFARLDLEGLQDGARIGVNSQKRNLSDFALWKFCSQAEKRDMAWDSPWGLGFPGWHLECSAMAFAELGETIDLHAGGIDHIPVHHTNEIAQSEAASGKQFAKHWFHSAFLNVDGHKIAKSAGNGITLSDIEDKGFEPLALRMLVLRSKYRSQADFTWELLANAQTQLNHFRNLANLRFQPRANGIEFNAESSIRQLNSILLNDLNTAEFLAATLMMMPKEGQVINQQHIEEYTQFLSYLDEALGLGLLADTHDISDAEQGLIEQRQTARDNGDFMLSDTLRNKLQNSKLKILDTELGQIWERL